MSSSHSSRKFSVDFARGAGVVRPVNGVNLGPLSRHGTYDFSEYHRKLRIPLTRLHDCPYAVAETVDIHHIFPDFRADADDPSNYRFARTDAYIQSILDVGSQIVYRLGETIDHFRVKPFIDPPAEADKWATICVNIIRHYNDGWANGFHHGIRFWEIWNEPMNPPCWSGTWEQFLDLYETAATRIKAHDPSLQVGGAALAGDEPYWELRHDFVRQCARRGCPLDFLSWHIYTDQPAEILRRVRHVRELLDESGLAATASHLNEWNYLAENSWAVQLSGDPRIRRHSFQDMLGGAPGAAFTASVLMLLQDAPIDEANYYWAREGGWGLFDDYGAPRKNYYAMLAFAKLLELGGRVASEGSDAEYGLAICAAADDEQTSAAVLLSNQLCEQREYELRLANLPWAGETTCVISIVDEDRDLQPLPDGKLSGEAPTVTISLPPASVALVQIERAGGA